MRIVIALGGNALLRRGEPMTVENQRRAVAAMADTLAPLIERHEVVITHGNGPQVGLLALQAACYDQASEYPFDILGAQTDGMIGYLVEKELRSHCPQSQSVATLLTMTEVRPDDPAFDHPTKFVGPTYPVEQARELAESNGWTIAQDGDRWRRTVASPMPLRIVELRAISWMLDNGCTVICGGGGGIPVVRDVRTGGLRGVEAVVDKDRTSAVLGRDLDADLLVLATDAVAVAEGWGTRDERCIRSSHPDMIHPNDYAAGSMRPKVEAACDFVMQGRGDAVIGSLVDLAEMVEGNAGTRISRSGPPITYWAGARWSA